MSRAFIDQVIQFRRHLGYYPRPIPRTFNEKVFWRKFTERLDCAVIMADKVAVRDYVKATAGPEYLIPALAVVSQPEDLLLHDLPPEYVVKANHGSGMNAFIKEGQPPPLERLNEFLTTTFGVNTHEWWYARIPRRLIVEPLLKDASYGLPLDFKFFVFHGRVALVQVDFDRFTSHSRTFFDRDWKRQNFSFHFPEGPTIARPVKLAEMVELAEVLAGTIAFVRVDLYCLDDRDIRFGEMTFCPEAGWGQFVPRRADSAVGSLW